MKTKVLSTAEVYGWLAELPASPAIAILLQGDRLSCCDEAVALEIEGKIVGIATIAPRGEFGAGGQPSIVALYVLSSERQRGYGKSLLEAAIERCLERGFKKIRVDVMSAYAMRIINSLPEHLRAALDVRDHGDVMDNFA